MLIASTGANLMSGRVLADPDRGLERKACESLSIANSPIS